MNGLSRALLVLILVLLSGCADDGRPLWADPGVARLSPTQLETTIEIHNVSGTIRPVADFELGGEDWGSLRFVDDSLPRTIPANDSIVIRLAASPTSFREAPGRYRAGAAVLKFRSDQHAFEVPIEFVGTPAPSRAPPVWLSLLILALIGAAAIWPSHAGRALRGLELDTRAAVAGALAALLLVVAMLPLGPGWCSGRLGARVGPRELDQCRAGLGGADLTLVPATPGLWWLLVALVIAAASLTVARVRLDRRRDDAAVRGPAILACLRIFGLALIAAALLVGLAPASADPGALVLEQLEQAELMRLKIPAWGAFAQPLAALAALALAIPLTAADEHPIRAALDRLDHLLWSAIVVILLFGGWAIPGLGNTPVPALNQVATSTLEMLAFAVKLAVVYGGLTKVSQFLNSRDVGSSTILRAHARVTVPLLFVNLGLILVWRLI